MVKNKRAQDLLDNLGKYVLWFILVVVMAFGVSYLVKFLTGMGK